MIFVAFSRNIIFQFHIDGRIYTKSCICIFHLILDIQLQLSIYIQLEKKHVQHGHGMTYHNIFISRGLNLLS